MVSYDNLNVTDAPQFNDDITSTEYHTYLPYVSTSLKNDDEIRIPIHHQDLYTLPSQSYLHIEGKLKKTGAGDFPATTDLVCNAIAFLFSEIRYELNGIVVDITRNPGITSTLKGYVSYNSLANAEKSDSGWDNSKNWNRTTGYFDVAIPLSHLLGFCEDFKKILVNIRQELVLIRSHTNKDALEVTATDNDSKSTDIDLIRVAWKMPHISVNDVQRLRLLKTVESDPWLPIGFTQWEMHEYPTLQQTKTHTWTVKTAAALETPRYVILAFQTGKKNKLDKNPSLFDHCQLVNAKLFLNGVQYPYDNMNLDMTGGRYGTLYRMYSHFQSSFYETEENKPMMNVKDFLEKAPLVVFDCSRQIEPVKSGSVDIRLEWDTKDDVPAETTAYCLILHDKVASYRPLSGAVRVM